MPYFKIKSIMQRAEADKAVVLGVLTKIWRLGSGPITLLLIASRFSPELQGYYFTFYSIVALQVFVELGLGTVIIQFASHEWSKLKLNHLRQIEGSSDALSRLVSLGRIGFAWFGAAGGIMAFGIGSCGYLFLSRSSTTDIDWAAPWFVLCGLSGVSLLFDSVWALLQGCNQVSQVYLYRLMAGILSTMAIWMAIVFGMGLWACAISLAVTLAWGVVFLVNRYRKFLMPFFVMKINSLISWRHDIFPMQWKIALSWLSGYLSFSLFTPVMFHFHGAKMAGKIGMTWVIVAALSQVASTWSFAKAPRFGVLIALRDYVTLDRLFVRVMISSVVVAFSGSLVIWAVVYLMYSFGHPLSGRILPPLPTVLFLAGIILMQITIPQSSYLRAHKKEPFLALSVVGGLLTGLSTWLLGSKYGAAGMAGGFLGVRAFFSVPVATLIWFQCRKLWHSE